VHSSVFQTLTWLRGVGVLVFICGGVIPLLWFMVSRWFSLKPVITHAENFAIPASVLAFSEPPYPATEATLKEPVRQNP
jgi:hypothetical protein